MKENERLVIVGAGPGVSRQPVLTAKPGHGHGSHAGRGAVPTLPTSPLTKEYLRGEMGRDGLWIEDPEWYTDNGVELRLATRVKALDRQQNIIETEGGEFPYDACVLATGSEPVRVPVPGADDPRSGDEDARKLESSSGTRREGDRAVVVGSGFIGCEAAASLLSGAQR